MEKGAEVLTWIKASDIVALSASVGSFPIAVRYLRSSLSSSSKMQTSRQGEQWRKCACQRPVEQDLVSHAGLPWGQSDSDEVHVECVVGMKEDASIVPGLPLRRSHPTE